jgi:multiple sugar transport system substrate-binding protein
LRPLLSLGLLLLACSAPEAPPGEVSLWALGSEGEAVAAMAPAFAAAHPGLSVRVQRIPWSAAHEKLLTAYVGETLPDVFQIGVTWIAELAALGALEPLDARVAASAAVARADWFEGAWDASVVGGPLVALPWYVDTRLFFYRSDRFEAAGVAEAPRTWDAWRDALAAVQRSLGADRHAVFLPLSEWEPPVVWALSLGATLLRDGDRYGDFRSDAFRRAFAFHLEHFERGLAARSGAGASASLHRDFADGWFGAFLSGPWNLGELERRMPPALSGAWATLPVPGPDAERPGVSIAGGASLAIHAGSTRKDAAWKLVEWLSQPEQQRALYRATGDLPSRRSSWDDSMLEGDRRVAAFRAQLEHVRALPQVPEWERIAGRISRYTEAAVRGEMSADAALEALDRDADAILEKRRSLADVNQGAGR